VDSTWFWLIAGVLLAIAELVVPGVFLIWLGAAAIVTGIAALAFALTLPSELALFALTSAIAVVIGRAVMARLPILSDDPLLNERTARLVGRRVVVTEAISGGEGRVRVGDGIWPATGPDAPTGAMVEVVGADGARLIVEPADLTGSVGIEPGR
jgi:membrane protein implicated in regulation of membrane protease activity